MQFTHDLTKLFPVDILLSFCFAIIVEYFMKLSKIQSFIRSQMIKFPSKRAINKILAVICVALMFIYIVPHVAPHALAADFTVSNLTFDPTTGYLSFDYTGTSISQIDSITDGTGATEYWDRINGGCTSSHCNEVLGPYMSDSGVTSVVLHSSSYISQTLNYPLPLPTTNTPQTPIVGGWINVGETWTYASADAPTFTFTVAGDETGRYSPGMRIKLTQSSTAKYFIITAVSYSNPNTTVTVYGGTDYTLANATISNTYYSTQKAPQGFPLDPTKWTVEVTDSTQRSVTSPAVGTWYNPNAADQITIPIGAWNVEYYAPLYVAKNPVTWIYVKSTLSTASNSESDVDFTSYISNQGASSSMTANGVGTRRKTIALSSKTKYYFNIYGHSSASSLDSLLLNNTVTPLKIRAVSAYL